MNTIQDLHIEKEILPLFDNAIRLRQQVFKGFSENKKVLKKYSYPVSYLLEVYHFLDSFNLDELSQRKFGYKFLTSKKVKTEHRARISQMILLFYRLNSFCFSRLNTRAFPEVYQQKLREIIDFLSAFNLDHYDNLIREYTFRDTDVLTIFQKIGEQKTKGMISLFWENLFCFEAYFSINQTIDRMGFVYPA